MILIVMGFFNQNKFMACSMILLKRSIIEENKQQTQMLITLWDNLILQKMEK